MLFRWLDGLRKKAPLAEAATAVLAEASRVFAEKQYDDALACVARVLAVDSGNVAALQLQGAALTMKGDFAKAASSFAAALRLAPRDAGLRFDYGNALRVAGDADAAEIEYRRALALAPDSIPAHKALGSLLHDLRRSSEAVVVLQCARKLDPADADLLRLLGKAAFRSYDFVLLRDLLLPLYEENQLGLEELYILGTSFVKLGDYSSAGEVLEKALSIAPDDPAINLMMAFRYLYVGDWQEGFRRYEWRLKSMRDRPEVPAMKEWLGFIDAALAGVPEWQEGSVAGKRLLVWMEQGLGDAIMMLRVLPALLETCACHSVAFLCPQPLIGMAESFPEVRFVLAEPSWRSSAAEFDAHCSIMSLPRLMNITCNAIPGKVPYLFPSNALLEKWRGRAAMLSGLKVGLVWAGSPTLSLDALRSLALGQLAPVLDVVGVDFVSLQKDQAARAELSDSDFRIFDWMDDSLDMLETAAIIMNLDLVISVDTAVAHLAGALGKKVWLLNRFESEWRWMRDREDSVWYPSMKIFSQTRPRCWDDVVLCVAAELKQLENLRREQAVTSC